MQKQVIKRDGSLEPYDEGKVERVVLSAGLTKDQAHDVAVKTTQWMATLSEQTISSLHIRDKVSELLSATDENVAEFYRWYQKTKEIASKNS